MGSLKTRLVAGCVVVSLAVTGLAYSGFQITSSMTTAYEHAVSERAPQLAALTKASASLVLAVKNCMATAYTSDEFGHVSSGYSMATEEYKAFEDALEETNRWIHTFIDSANEEDERQYGTELDEAFHRLASTLHGLLKTAQDHGENPAWDTYQMQVGEQLRLVLGMIEEAVEAELEELKADHGEVAETRVMVERGFLSASVVAIGVVSGLALLLIWNVRTPMRHLTKAAELYGSGELEYRVPRQSVTEFELLACSLNDMAERLYQSRREQDAMHRQLNDLSRKAGMAEVATGVLHNVGNVLNSVNISAEQMSQKIGESRIDHLKALATLLSEHEHDLGAFVTDDPRGTHLPAFILKLSEHLDQIIGDVQTDIEDLTSHIEHIKDVISTQQSFSRVVTVMDQTDLGDLVREAVRFDAESLKRHRIEVKTQLDEMAPIVTDRHKVLQILVNLISNAKQAMVATPEWKREIELRLVDLGDEVAIELRDHGCGFGEDVAKKLFTHGFTTRPDGHGFGLHSGVLHAKELGGSLTGRSDGPGRGATFRLRLPKKANATITPRETEDQETTTAPVVDTMDHVI